MKGISRIRRDPLAAVFCVASFFLLYEWLIPLSVVIDKVEIEVFLCFVAVNLCMAFASFRGLITTLIKSAYIIGSLYFLYFDTKFYNEEWLITLCETLQKGIEKVWLGELDQLPPEFRTFLLFIFLWLVGYLVNYWIFHQRRIFLFLIITTVYITVLDTFSPYDAKYAIIRTIIVGFSLTSLLHIDRLKNKEPRIHYISGKRNLFMMIISTVFLISLSAYFAPKAAPQWPDPVPFLTAHTKEKEGNNVEKKIRKIGYGLDDSQLGGSLIGDPTVVFYAEAKQRNYWRIETKDLYTGTGWESSMKAESLPLKNGKFSLFQYEERVETKTLTAGISLAKPSIYIIYPFSTQSIEVGGRIKLRVNPLTEKIYPLRGESLEPVSFYNVTYSHPIFRVENLKEAEFRSSPNALEGNPTFIKRYTQLPVSLPARVRDLASEITRNGKTRYDKVKAIEHYFGTGTYAYDTGNVPVPVRGQDYVDQFLFDSQRGYCDNFSTSMVVMLRSLNIPARWVKGYTYGKAIGNLDEETTKYEITQNDAHSWVEVYFPGSGWVPFEPTKSFTNPLEFSDPLPSNSPVSGVSRHSQVPAPAIPKIEGEQNNKPAGETEERRETPWTGLLLITFLLCGLLLIIYKYKNAWLYHSLIFIYKKRNDETAFSDAYISLLKLLEQKGLKKEDGQTLRQYANYIDKCFDSKEMSLLTERYERITYSKDEAKKEWGESVELWENLIKKTCS